MRVLFVYPNQNGTIRIPLGIAYLSAVAKQRGHQTALLDATWGYNPQTFLSRARSFRPDLVAISTLTLDYLFASNIAELLKVELGVPICMGGIHPTVEPEEVISNPFVDMICLGEGDEAFSELLDATESGRDVSRIDNFWIKTSGGEIHRNPLRPMISNIDDLPFPDWALFDSRHLTEHEAGAPVMTARGCPYSCTYCVNQTIKDLYRDKGKHVRFRRIDSVIEEMKEICRRFAPHSFFIEDETLLARGNTLRELSAKYKSEIGIPFRCMGRVDQTSREALSLLKEAGCESIAFGIETGNERIRREMLGRQISDEVIIDAFRLAREAGLKTHSFNMIGLPGETRADVMKTVELNRRCQPTTFQVSILHPFVGTKIRSIYVEKGWLNEDSHLTSVYGQSAVSLPDLPDRDLVLLQEMFPLYYLFPNAKILHWMAGFAYARIPGRLGRSVAYRLSRLIRELVRRRSS